MRILIVNREYPPYAWGGMGRVVEYIERFSAPENMHVTIISNHPRLSITKEIKSGNVTVYRVPTLGKTFLTKVPSFDFFASRLVSKLQNNHDLI